MDRKLLEKLTLALVLLQASTGLVFDLYRDQDWVKATWFGNDLVTLLLVVPAYYLSLTRKGFAGSFLHFGCLGYVTYNYAFYLFGASLNIQFPLYVAIFIMSIVNMASGVGSASIDGLYKRFDAGKPNKLTAAIYLFIGAGLGLVWLLFWFLYVFTGKALPVAPDQFRLVAAMDLIFIVPLFIYSAVGLLRKKPAGYAFGAMIGIHGGLYLLVLFLNSLLLSIKSGTPGETPVWGTLLVIEAIGAARLAGNRLRKQGDGETGDPH